MSFTKIKILEFSDDLQEPIKTLNYEWLQKYFELEEKDIISLSNPKKEIIDKGGFIFYAKLNDEIVGTYALLKRKENVFEMSKMAVSTIAQGRKIGTTMLEHCLRFATQKEIKTIILYSNTQLESAIHLYRKYGFIEVDLETDMYERANIKMEKHL
ncbi:GNAT family N-acetyltransferase [Mesonia ostreae]|uniref:GNAT family N-acetyltransferase n=1 Tax=Mesonia ostreae TaxID=861110 RepID=A0ABU2KEP2_9FLAO|nr:GNAT family N-acetyltransferase [Mesonia ostreae]MDT0293160.1 GNAT family N-acetyltransferase [Mesonia ostreae]